MNEWYDQAAKKLAEEMKSGKFSPHAGAMKSAVCEALEGFCRQDGEFAQAVVQGGSFEDCMKAVEKGVGSSISDLEAFKKAVAFYFPGADVRFHMTVDLCASVEDAAPEQEPSPARPRRRGMIIDLDDFL